MAQDIPTLIDRALDDAAAMHFAHLFKVLIANESADEASMDRFEIGLRKAIDIYDKTAALIEDLKLEYAAPKKR